MHGISSLKSRYRQQSIDMSGKGKVKRAKKLRRWPRKRSIGAVQSKVKTPTGEIAIIPRYYSRVGPSIYDLTRFELVLGPGTMYKVVPSEEQESDAATVKDAGRVSEAAAAASGAAVDLDDEPAISTVYQPRSTASVDYGGPMSVEPFMSSADVGMSMLTGISSAQSAAPPGPDSIVLRTSQRRDRRSAMSAEFGIYKYVTVNDVIAMWGVVTNDVQENAYAYYPSNTAEYKTMKGCMNYLYKESRQRAQHNKSVSLFMKQISTATCCSPNISQHGRRAPSQFVMYRAWWSAFGLLVPASEKTQQELKRVEDDDIELDLLGAPPAKQQRLPDRSDAAMEEKEEAEEEKE